MSTALIGPCADKIVLKTPIIMLLERLASSALLDSITIALLKNALFVLLIAQLAH